MQRREAGKLLIRIAVMAVFAAVAVCAVFLSFEQTRAWLLPEEKAEAEVAVSDFKIQGKAFFKDTETDLTSISLTRGNANYLGDLRYEITCEGISPAFVRVRILEQWVDKNTNVIKDMPFTDYIVSGGAISPGDAGSAVWYDNRENDYYFYYMADGGLFAPESLVSGGAVMTGKRTITLFDGVNMNSILASDSNTEIRIIIEVEAVQPNRYREFWGIEHLPWEMP